MTECWHCGGTGLVRTGSKDPNHRKDCSHCEGSGRTRPVLDDFPDDLFPDAEIPLEAQIKCIQREIKYRKRVYTRRIAMGRMGVKFATQQIDMMRAVLKTLEELRNDLRNK